MPLDKNFLKGILLWISQGITSVALRRDGPRQFSNILMLALFVINYYHSSNT